MYGDGDAMVGLVGDRAAVLGARASGSGCVWGSFLGVFLEGGFGAGAGCFGWAGLGWFFLGGWVTNETNGNE